MLTICFHAHTTQLQHAHTPDHGNNSISALHKECLAGMHAKLGKIGIIRLHAVLKGHHTNSIDERSTNKL